MSSRLAELIVHLRTIQLAPERALTALRVPPACHELGAVATACEPALIRLCDHHDAAPLLDARDVVRGILRLLPQNADLSRNDYRSLDAVPDTIDHAYRALPQYQPMEWWWQETLREALLVRLLFSPDTATVDLLAVALRRVLPISLVLRQPQNAPAVRISILVDCLTALGTEYSRLTQALADTAALLETLPALRRETLHSDNAAALEELRRTHQASAPVASPRERLSRLARDIGVVALAQRRAYHAPPSHRLPSLETLHDLIRRSSRWSKPERIALQATLLLGRLGSHLLQTDNQDPHCHIERRLHEVWVQRRLPELPEFTRQLEGPGYAHVGRQLHLPLPRRLGHALATIGSAGGGNDALRGLQKKLRDLSRDSGQPVTIRRLSRLFEYELENETPDEATMTLLGLQAQARRDAGIHYFAPCAPELAGRVCAVVERLVAKFDLDGLDDGWSVLPPAPTPFMGYSYRADAQALRSLMAMLQSTAELSRGRTNPQRVITAYNARVARLTLMYLAATGGRPTGTVLPTRADISLEDRAAVASEKDALGYRSTRLVPLSDRLIAEIREFERWASAKHLLPHNASADAPLAMLRAANGTFATPTITALKETVAGFVEHWVWPDDVLRHLFRSRLWEMRCPSSWLRRAMGHHPPHGAADMPWCARLQWDGLHDWTEVIDEHLEALGF
jgi:hypothetical protein